MTKMQIFLLVLFTAIATFIFTYNLVLMNQEIEPNGNGYNVIIFGEVHYYE